MNTLGLYILIALVVGGITLIIVLSVIPARTPFGMLQPLASPMPTSANLRGTPDHNAALLSSNSSSGTSSNLQPSLRGALLSPTTSTSSASPISRSLRTPIILGPGLPSLPSNAVIRTPQWPAQPPDIAFLENLPDRITAAIGSSPAPVLLPDNPDLAARSLLIIRPTGYTATIDNFYPTIQVSIRAEAIQYTLPSTSNKQPNAHVRQSPAYLIRGEVGWFLSWEEFGISYELFLGCEAQTSEDCTADSIEKIASSLIYAGGKGAVL
jgi:hypothetical protein